MKKQCRNAVLAGILLLGGLVSLAAEQPAGFRFVPAHTRIGLARVTLLVSDLAYQGNGLTGSYEVRIPMAPWKNDRGEMRLELREPLDSLVASGRSVTGSSHSSEDGRVHPVTCCFATDGTVRITIETDKLATDHTSPTFANDASMAFAPNGYVIKNWLDEVTVGPWVSLASTATAVSTVIQFRRFPGNFFSTSRIVQNWSIRGRSKVANTDTPAPGDSVDCVSA